MRYDPHFTSANASQVTWSTYMGRFFHSTEVYRELMNMVIGKGEGRQRKWD
jgi:hypothetical protein